MYLKPVPRKFIMGKENFTLNYYDSIVLSSRCSFGDLETAKILQKNIEKILFFKLSIKKAYEKDFKNNTIRLIKEEGLGKEEYKLNITKDYIEIVGTEDAGIFYGVQTLIQIIKNQGAKLNNLKIEDSPYFKNRGYYYDITRGKVPTLETLKELVDKLASYKINQLQLYIEHSFSFSEFTEVWCDKDPITAEEILILDDYCKRRYIELVPSIAIFGHLYEILRSESCKRFCELDVDEKEFSFFDRMAHHTIDVSNKESLVLIEKMIDEFLPLFSSNKFNIGCDETFDLGKGKSAKLLSGMSSGELYVDFLNKIINIGKKHNKEVLFWGDVILRYKDLFNKIESDITCLNWNYSHEASEDGTKIIAETGINQYVCPGVAGWNHFMNLIDQGYENISRMISYGVKYSANGVLTTDWGDYGHINFLANSIPLMIHSAALSWNPHEKINKEEDFKGISFLEYNDKSKSIVDILKRLSKCQSITWYEVVRWKEKRIDKKELLEIIGEDNPIKIRENYFIARDLEEELKEISYKLNKDKSLDFNEFLISAQAIALINDFALHLLRKEFKKEESVPINTPNDLAVAMEIWLYRYKLLWRKRNKESELIRIVEVIKYLCKYLRKL